MPPCITHICGFGKPPVWWMDLEAGFSHKARQFWRLSLFSAVHTCISLIWPRIWPSRASQWFCSGFSNGCVASAVQLLAHLPTSRPGTGPSCGWFWNKFPLICCGHNGLTIEGLRRVIPLFYVVAGKYKTDNGVIIAHEETHLSQFPLPFPLHESGPYDFLRHKCKHCKEKHTISSTAQQ